MIAAPWKVIRELQAPFANDPDWVSTQDVAGAGSAQFGIPMLEHGGAPVTGIILLPQPFDAGNTLITTPGFSIGVEIIEFIGTDSGSPVSILNVLPVAVTIPFNSFEDFALTLATPVPFAMIGSGSYALRVTFGVGTPPGTETVRIFKKNVTG